METLNFVNIAGSLIAIIVQIIHRHYYDRRFRESFKNFKLKIDDQLKEKAKKRLSNIQKKVKELETQELIELSRNLANDLEKQNEPVISYLEIHKRIKFFYLFSLGSIFFTILSYKVSKIGEILSMNLGFLLLLIAVISLVWTIWDLNKLEEQILKSEFGTPLEKIWEK